MNSRCLFMGQCLLVASFCVSVPAFADDAPFSLGQVVVTATRTAQTQATTLAPTTVIDRAQIEQLQPASLPDLLAMTPGLAISNNGGPGKATGLFLRGTATDQTLILVDGINVGSVTTGNAALQDIPVNQIQRIEIVRGPFSSLYGANTIGGVIQIFLRHAPGSFTPHASLGFGSHAHRKVAAGFSAANEQGWLSVEASHNKTHGINACRVGAAEVGTACFADQPDKDGFRDDSLSVHGAYRFNDRWSADALALRSQGTNEYDGSFSNSTDYATQVLGAQLHYLASDSVKFSLRAGGSADFSDNFLDRAHASRYDSRRRVASLQADIAVAGGLLTTGLDWQRQHLDSSARFNNDTRTNRAVFAEWQEDFGTQSLKASLRRDSNSQFGGATTGSVSWGWRFAPDLRLTAGYGSAFRAPTFNELYFPGYGNPDLGPERSDNLELGLRGTPDWGQWSLHAYRDDIHDQISFNAAAGLPDNVGRVRITGLEGVAATTLAGWRLRASATLLNARVTAQGPLYGNDLPRRPPRSVRFDAHRNFGRFSFGASWSLADRRYDDLANRHPLGGYGLVGLRAGWAINRDWGLQLAVNNVLDKDYETAWFFNQPGRTFMLTLRYRPAS